MTRRKKKGAGRGQHPATGSSIPPQRASVQTVNSGSGGGADRHVVVTTAGRALDAPPVMTATVLDEARRRGNLLAAQKLDSSAEEVLAPGVQFASLYQLVPREELQQRSNATASTAAATETSATHRTPWAPAQSSFRWQRAGVEGPMFVVRCSTARQKQQPSQGGGKANVRRGAHREGKYTLYRLVILNRSCERDFVVDLERGMEWEIQQGSFIFFSVSAAVAASSRLRAEHPVDSKSNLQMPAIYGAWVGDAKDCKAFFSLGRTLTRK